MRNLILLVAALVVIFSSITDCNSDDDDVTDDDVADDDVVADDDTIDDDTTDDDTIDDDTTDDDTIDDDTTDDDTISDDDVANLTCTEAYDYMYDDCLLVFLDAYGNLIEKEWIIYWCQEGEPGYSDVLYDCINDNFGDCYAVEECLIEALSGGDDDVADYN